MNTGNRKFRAAVVVVGIGLLCGCAASRPEKKTANVPEDEPTVRLPYGTPLKIEQATPPTVADRTASPPDVEEGRAHSLKLFQVDFGQKKAGPTSEEETPGPSEAEPEP